MNIDRPKLLNVILLSATLSSLFFYPLFSELNDNILILQWRWINTVELFCAFLLISLLAGLAFYFIFKCKNAYIKLLILLTIASIPLMSFSVYFFKQLLDKGFIITTSRLLFNQYIISLFLITIFFISMRYPRKIVRAVIL